LVRRPQAAGAGAGPPRRGVQDQDRACHHDGHRGGGRGRAVRLGRGDEVYGRSSKLRAACEQAGKGYVLAVPVNFRARLHPRLAKIRADAAARLVPATAWEARSCGPGCKGHRDYEWAWAATASPRHWLLIRRSLSAPSELAFFY